MRSKLCAATLTARAEAYQEAAEHLELDWTSDPLEREQGKRLTSQCWAESQKWRRLAASAKMYTSDGI